MSFLDATVLVTRWAHVLATITWVGGNIFFLVVLRPALRRSDGPGGLAQTVGAGFKQTVDLAMWVLIVTGGVLIYDRLTQEIGIPYAVILGVKLLLSAGMFLLAISLSRRGPRRTASPLEGAWAEILPGPVIRVSSIVRARWAQLASPANLLFALGPVIVLLGLLLRAMAG